MKLSKSKWILISVITLIVIAVSAITIYFCVRYLNNDKSNDSNTNKPSTPEQVLQPELSVKDSISIDVLEQTYKFIYSCKNLGEYKVSVVVEDLNIAKINNDGYIIPVKVGTTNITTTINCEPAIVKNTKLTILDIVTSVEFNVTDLNSNKVETLYKNNEYYLNITKDKNVNDYPEISFDENLVTDFKLVSNNKNEIKFSFKSINYGEIFFNYKSKYCDNTFKINSYIYPENFDVEFTNVVPENNVINLYIFDNSKSLEANQDLIYNDFVFNVKTIQNSNDEIEVSLNGSSIELNNNKITAKTDGEATLTFKSKITKQILEYKIKVSTIIPDKILFNGNDYNFGESENIEFENDVLDFNVNYLPEYAVCNFNIQTDLNCSYENNKLTINNNFAVVKIYLHSELVLTLNYTRKSNYEFKVDLGEYALNTSINGNQINVVYSQNLITHISCLIYNKTTNSLHTNQDFTLQIEDASIVNLSSNKFLNGNIYLKILKVGNTKITFKNEVLNINIEYLINII